MKNRLPSEKLIPFLNERFKMGIEAKSGVEIVRTSAEVRADAKLPNVAICKASSQVVDADGDLMVAEGCDFTAFATRGIVTTDHDYNADKLVAKPIKAASEEGGVFVAMEFGPTTYAQDILKMVKAGIVKAVSVGFQTLADVKKGQAGWNEAVKKYASHLQELVVPRSIPIILAMEFSAMWNSCYVE